MAQPRLTASQYLRSLQDRCMRSGYVPRYSVDPSVLAEAERRGIKSVGDTSIKEWFARINSAPMPTDLENRFFYPVMRECVPDVRKYAKELGYEATTEICYGTLPTDDFNGMAIKAPGVDGVIVVLNHGAIVAMLEMATAIASFFAFKPSQVDGFLEFATDTTDWDRRFAENLPGHVSYVQAACSCIGLPAWVTSAEPLEVVPDSWERAREQVGKILADQSTMFIIAHEYAHVTLGHSSANAVNHRIQDVSVERITRSWQQETGADELGAAIMMRFCLENGHSFATMLAGAEFFFLCANLAERMIGAKFSSSHPPALGRRERIRKAFAAASPDIAGVALATGDMMERIFDRLWARNLIHIVEAVKQIGQRRGGDAPTV